jgi:hypothetical protein
MANTLYDTLEVIPTASPETIHAAYRSLISRYHPDRVAGLGPELQAIANARAKEITHAYDILRDAARRASYDEELREAEDEELREAESPPLRWQDLTAAHGARAPDVERPPGRRLRATLLAALAGIAALLTLPLAANVTFGVVDFFATGHARNFQGLVNSIDTNVSYWGASYLLVLWGWLFANYLFGLISYRLGVGVGRRVSSGFGEPFAGTNDRLLLFLTFVCVIAGSELFSSMHTMPDIFADMFVLAGAYLAERGITWPDA